MGSTPVGGIGLREELGFEIVSPKASADPQEALKLRQFFSIVLC